MRHRLFYIFLSVISFAAGCKKEQSTTSSAPDLGPESLYMTVKASSSPAKTKATGDNITNDKVINNGDSTYTRAGDERINDIFILVFEEGSKQRVYSKKFENTNLTGNNTSTDFSGVINGNEFSPRISVDDTYIFAFIARTQNTNLTGIKVDDGSSLASRQGIDNTLLNLTYNDLIHSVVDFQALGTATMVGMSTIRLTREKLGPRESPGDLGTIPLARSYSRVEFNMSKDQAYQMEIILDEIRFCNFPLTTQILPSAFTDDYNFSPYSQNDILYYESANQDYARVDNYYNVSGTRYGVASGGTSAYVVKAADWNGSFSLNCGSRYYPGSNWTPEGTQDIHIASVPVSPNDRLSDVPNGVIGNLFKERTYLPSYIRVIGHERYNSGAVHSWFVPVYSLIGSDRVYQLQNNTLYTINAKINKQLELNAVVRSWTYYNSSIIKEYSGDDLTTE